MVCGFSLRGSFDIGIGEWCGVGVHGVRHHATNFVWSRGDEFFTDHIFKVRGTKHLANRVKHPTIRT